MRPSAPLLRVRDLSITHAGAAHPSPRGVSFDVFPGEVVLLLGPSGSGKSTLTLALNGLIPQSIPARIDGTVEVSGLSATETPVARLSTDVAMVFQDPDAQVVTGTVLDEVAFALENQLLPVDDVLARSEAALRRVGLWERRAWNPHLLSGGGRQRLAIACALAMGSRMLVLDEPAANLDPQGTADVHAALADLAADGDRAILLVEHDHDSALRIATRVLELSQDGAVVYDGEAARWTPRGRQAAAGQDPHASGLGGAHGGLSPARLPSPSRLPGDTEAAVVVRGLRVVKRGDEVLRVDRLDIAAGSFTAVVGANGTGKTTLVQALAGVTPPPAGTVHVADLDAGTASPRQLAARIGFVFQNPEHQFIAHTVFDELAHGLRLQRLPSAEIDQRVADVLERFDLTHKAQTHPFLLSGGEKRRLSVGTAMITRPRVLVLDEPTFGQDPDRAGELLRLLTELQDDGTTVVIVTHDLRLVAAYATHTVVLGGGALRASGSTAEILADDALLVTAGLRMPVVDASDTGRVSSRSLTGELASGQTGPVPAGQRGQVSLDASPPERSHDSRPYPYAEPPAPHRFWLHHLNPLAKAGAVLPAIVLLVFTRDLVTPTAFLVLSYLVILSGARLTRRSALLLFAGVPVGMVAIAFGFSLWVSPAIVETTAPLLRIGDWTLYAGALLIGAATALRLGAILALALIGGLTTTGPDLVRAGVQQLGIPYRIGYTALASYRFVPRFGYELSIIRAAHRVRGHHGRRGPFARIARGWGYVLPLLTGGIRHAERVALAMDARAFGAYPTRTERHLTPWRMRDTAFTIAVLAASAAVLVATFPWQLS